MSNNERRFFTPRPQEIQSVNAYGEFEKSPPVVVRQTSTLLSLFYQGAIRKPGLAKDYLHDYTIEFYLKPAELGSTSLFNKEGQSLEDIDLEVREAARHAFVVFAWMPDIAKSSFFPEGFSRRGIFKAPTTQEQFLARVRELKLSIWQVVEGEMGSHTILEAYPPLLRTFMFFKVGSNLPIKLTPDEKEQEQIAKERFNDLLGDIDVSL